MPNRAIVVLALTFAVAAGACGPWAVASLTLRDEPVPASLAVALGPARESIASNIDGIGPVYLRFVEARCVADGEFALIFEVRAVKLAVFSIVRFLGPPFGPAYAWAATGSGRPPPGEPWGFSGGIGIEDPDTDAELAHVLSGSARVPCT